MDGKRCMKSPAPNRQLNVDYIIKILSVQIKMKIMNLSIFSYHCKAKMVHDFMPSIEINARQKIKKNVALPKLIF